MMNFGVKLLMVAMGLCIPFSGIQTKANNAPTIEMKKNVLVDNSCIDIDGIYIRTNLNKECVNNLINKHLNSILAKYNDETKDKLKVNYEKNKQENNSLNAKKEKNTKENLINKTENAKKQQSDKTKDINKNITKENLANTQKEKKDNSNKEKNNGGSTKNTENVQVNSSFSTFQNKILELVNNERAKSGVKPLRGNTELSKVATIKAQDMIDKGYFDHTSPTYGSPFDMIKKFGISYTAAGENIAYGQRTPEEVMNGWMNSPGHRQNILSSNFEQIGIGIAKTSNGTMYWTQMFIK